METRQRPSLSHLSKKNQGTLSSSSYGWNHKYNPDTGLYDRPISDTGDPLFQSGNFGDIFA